MGGRGGCVEFEVCQGHSGGAARWTFSMWGCSSAERVLGRDLPEMDNEAVETVGSLGQEGRRLSRGGAGKEVEEVR